MKQRFTFCMPMCLEMEVLVSGMRNLVSGMPALVLGIEGLGPTFAPMSILVGRWRMQVVLRGSNPLQFRNWLQEIIFGRINDLCTQLQWVSIDMLLPLQSEFDPREHIMCDKQDAGKEFRNFVVGIEQAGFFTYDGSSRVRKARVHVGS